MEDKGFFNFQCKISRKGSGYGLTQETITSTLHQFYSKSEMHFLLVGSSPKSNIQIADLAPQHISLVFSADHLTMETPAPCEFVTKKERRQLQEKQSVRIPISDRVKWEVIFPNQAALSCKVYEEMFFFPEKLMAFLEKEYGKLDKIWESTAFCTFKTADNRVLKILQPSYIDNKKITERFEKAAIRFQRLPHDLFLKINKVVNNYVDMTCYAEMEYIEGESLDNYVARQGTIPVDEANSIARQIAERLVVLQERGYCVRNLTPQNVLLCQDGSIRLTGFFLLKDYSVQMTQQDDQMVIPNYSSPEQLENASRADIYSDIFSLGAIFHHLLLGEPPFTANNRMQYQLMLASAKPITKESLQAKAPKIAPELCKLMAAMLSFDKGQRPAPRQIITMLGGGLEKKERKGLWQSITGMFRMTDES